MCVSISAFTNLDKRSARLRPPNWTGSWQDCAHQIGPAVGRTVPSNTGQAVGKAVPIIPTDREQLNLLCNEGPKPGQLLCYRQTLPSWLNSIKSIIEPDPYLLF